MSQLAGVNEHEESSFQMKICSFRMSAKLVGMTATDAPFWQLFVSRPSTKVEREHDRQVDDGSKETTSGA